MVPVTSEGGKFERPPLVEQRLEILDLTRRAGRLNLVVVDDRREIGQLVLAGAQRGFPDRAFVDLAVAHYHDDAVVALLDPSGERHADTVGQAMAECSGRSLDAGHLRGLGMTPED